MENSSPLKGHSEASSLKTKRKTLANEVRRNYLSEFFKTRRIEFQQEQQNEQLEKLFCEKIDIFREMRAKDKNADQLVSEIWSIFSQNDHAAIGLLRRHNSDFLDLFLAYPLNPKCCQFLFNLIRYAYRQTFESDDLIFQVSRQQNSQQQTQDLNRQAKLQGTSFVLAKSQECLILLFKTIQHQIPHLLHHRANKAQIQSESKNHLSKEQEYNESLLKLYLSCLQNLALQQCEFAIDGEITKRFVMKWMEQLFLKYKFCHQGFLFYLNVVSLRTFSFKILNKELSLVISSQEAEIEKSIINVMFHSSIPTPSTIRSDKTLLLSAMLIFNSFSDNEVFLYGLFQYYPRLLQLIKIVCNYGQYFNETARIKAFEFIFNSLNVVCHQVSEMDEAGISETLKAMNMFEQIQNLGFLETFSIMLNTCSERNCEVIYSILAALVEYMVVCRIPLECLFTNENQLLFCMVSALEKNSPKIIAINLKALLTICEYIEGSHESQLFGLMLDYKINQTLQGLDCYKNEYVVSMAEMLSKYFTEDKIYEYSNYKSELLRYETDDFHLQLQY